MTYPSRSTEETKMIAKKLASELRGGELIALEGDLGAGKTTFVQGLAEGFGVKEPVRSPTFTVMNHYKTKHKIIKEIVHVDLYRLEEETDLFHLGLEEWIDREDTILIIEWPKMLKDKADILIHMEGEADEREIAIKNTA